MGFGAAMEGATSATFLPVNVILVYACMFVIVVQLLRVCDSCHLQDDVHCPCVLCCYFITAQLRQVEASFSYGT